MDWMPFYRPTNNAKTLKSIIKVTRRAISDNENIIRKLYQKPSSTTLMLPAHPGAPTDATV